MTIAPRPLIRPDTAIGPEVTARVQPNSFSMGLKKTPIETYVPTLSIRIRKLAETII
jgi:hypothetical protein